MIQNIGITGQNGFIGCHLYNSIKLYPHKYKIVEFQRAYFDEEKALDDFVSKCDVIIHLAGLNRHANANEIYDINILLAQKLISASERTASKVHIVFASSLQEENDNLYGKSKRVARLLFRDWAIVSKNVFTGLIIPNVFGPFGSPFYNSVVATFSHQIINSETPKIEVDSDLRLIYVLELVNQILYVIDNKIDSIDLIIKHTSEIKVSSLLKKLNEYKANYLSNGMIPSLKNIFELNLFNTFRSYCNFERDFPRPFKNHTDDRGSFVEIVRSNIKCQISYSSTLPGVTRGNHFHTRKIERFAVIKGEALIQLRRIGSSKVINLHLSGKKPSYVDIPIWHAHNIQNVGNSELLTIFWINEFYDSNDSDTFFEIV